MSIRGFITHKLSEYFSDCQDRFSINPDTKSIAVSDGMGSTWQQKIWAQLLVETFTESREWQPTHENIKQKCSVWREKVVDFIQNLKDTNAPINLVFRNERNLINGRSAGATFVGIRFDGSQWSGTVLGDSCLIEWDGVETTFHTSQEGDEFDSYPDYFDSDKLKQGKGTPKAISGILEKGGYLFLVSDPFSDFLLEHKKQGDVAIYMQQLLNLSSHEEFETLVDEWRKAGMHNDDTTLVIVEPDESDVFSIDKDKVDDINKLIDVEKKLIEEKKKEEEEKEKQILALVSNDFIEGKTVENVTEKEKKHESIPVEKQELYSPSDSSDNDVINKAITIDDHQEILPVEEDVFRADFLTEYKNALQKNHSRIGELKFKWTQKAIIDAVTVMYKKYSIFIK